MKFFASPENNLYDTGERASKRARLRRFSDRRGISLEKITDVALIFPSMPTSARGLAYVLAGRSFRRGGAAPQKHKKRRLRWLSLMWECRPRREALAYGLAGRSYRRGGAAPTNAEKHRLRWLSLRGSADLGAKRYACAGRTVLSPRGRGSHKAQNRRLRWLSLCGSADLGAKRYACAGRTVLSPRGRGSHKSRKTPPALAELVWERRPRREALRMGWQDGSFRRGGAAPTKAEKHRLRWLSLCGSADLGAKPRS